MSPIPVAEAATHYISTRARDASSVGIGAAIAAGLAPDGGLFVPAELPHLSRDAFDGATTLAATTQRLLAPFFTGDPLAAELPRICEEAFNFDAPLRALLTPDDYVLELFHGPTAAFKDFGARFLAACLARLRAGKTKPLTILVATSGDTGAAVAAAFHQRPGLRVVVLYPDGRVAPRQAHQLGCFGDNVTALRVAGSFDDCQRLVKHALNDGPLQKQVPLSSANSISLGRLLPQMGYYAHTALQFERAHGRVLNFVVPTGNLGNALAAIVARDVGLPIGRVVLATNANDVVPRFLAGGDYAPRASVATLANAMDVGAPSNIERLRWLHDDTSLRHDLEAHAVDDATIRATITARYKDHGEVFCPHTATAVHVLETLRARGVDGDWAVTATAHPAKFDTIVEPLIGRTVEIPPALSHLLSRRAHAEPMQATDEALRDVLLAL